MTSNSYLLTQTSWSTQPLH